MTLSFASNKEIEKAIKILNEGGIVIYPTDTAFGIGCRIDKKESVEKLFSIRKRPSTQAFPVLVDGQEMAEKYFLSPISNNVRHLMENYWPGALTIVYYANEVFIPPSVRAGSKTVGLRMPGHDVPLTLIKAIGVPIVGSSANFHGEPTPFEYSQLDKELVKLADYVIPGECYLKQASTVVDCTGEPFKILRQGAVKLRKVMEKKSVILYIDTSNNKEINVSLTIDGKQISKTVSNSWISQSLLPAIENLLAENNFAPKDLTEIKVNPGPGSYTGIRVGIAVANTLSYLLDIPLNGKKNQTVTPTYLTV